MKILHPALFVSIAVLTFAVSAAEPPVPVFRAVDVDTKVGIGYGVTVADINGDRKPDIVLVDKDVVAWYQNPTWEKHIIAEKLTEKDHVCIAAADIDGDGKAEIAVGAQWNPGDTVNSGAVFYLIPPADRTQKWEPVKLTNEPTVHRMRWVKNRDGKFALVVLPLHGRGNKDGHGAGVKALAYHMPADPRQPWATEVIDDTLHITHNFQPVKWERQPGDELLVASKEGVFHLLPEKAHWKRVQLTGNVTGETNNPGAGEVRAGKLQGGTRFLATIEPWHGNSVVTYTAGKNSHDLWQRHVIDETVVDGHAVACGDLLGTGSDQLVVGWRAMNRPGTKVGIRLYTPLDREGHNWRATVVDDNQMACEDLCLADLNGDGRLDIVAAGRATKNLKIYFNESAAVH
ncbi:MAG TPA: FG-GAP and VCBS repeat-containing protein [Verrucomicrobiae bacterium]|nr:FG-GAP and VCBS repeat-containing protein [Verrucomicrobiae bacterium]